MCGNIQKDIQCHILIYRTWVYGDKYWYNQPRRGDKRDLTKFTHYMNAPGNFFQFESIIAEASKGLVHHMMLYGCYDATPPRPIGTQWNCYDDGTNMPSSMCTTAIFGWTIGSGVRSCYTHFQTLIFKALSWNYRVRKANQNGYKLIKVNQC